MCTFQATKVSFCGTIFNVPQEWTELEENSLSLEKVQTYFKSEGMDHLIREFPSSSATVVLAAKALECEERRIAKTLSFQVDEKPVLIVTSGDAKVDNGKYKAFFGAKA